MLWERQLVGPEETNVPIRYGSPTQKQYKGATKNNSYLTGCMTREEKNLANNKVYILAKQKANLT